MVACSHCGQDIPHSTTWRALTVNDRAEVFWQGLKVKRMPRGQALILKALAARGFASKHSLEFLTEAASTKSVEVQVSHLRKSLAERGIPLGIVAQRGLGYMLEERNQAGDIDPMTA